MLLLFFQSELQMVVHAARKKENIKRTFETFLLRDNFTLMIFQEIPSLLCLESHFLVI